MPTSLWVSTTQDLGDDMTANLRADIDTDSKNAVIDCRVNSGRDSVAVDFDTADSTMGPLRITKHLDLNGRKVGGLLLLNAVSFVLGHVFFCLKECCCDVAAVYCC